MPLEAIVMEYVIFAALQLNNLIIIMECAQAYNAFCCLAEYNVAESEFLHGPNKARIPLANSLSG